MTGVTCNAFMKKKKETNKNRLNIANQNSLFKVIAYIPQFSRLLEVNKYLAGGPEAVYNEYLGSNGLVLFNFWSSNS